MKLTEYTVKKGIENKLTIKGRTGGYKSDGSVHEVTMTFKIEDGDFEEMVVKDANQKIRESLADLSDVDEADWLRKDTEAQTKYKESK